MKVKTKTPRISLPIIQATWNNCTKCEIGKHCRQKVFYDDLGDFRFQNETIDILFIGEAPGTIEDVEGTPFVGPAGQLLRKAIKEAGTECPNCKGIGTIRIDTGFTTIDSYGSHKMKPCPLCTQQGFISIGFTNLIACRPYSTNPRSPTNRPPLLGEINNCSQRLVDTIVTMNPVFIVALGKEAADSLPNVVYELGKKGIIVQTARLLHPSYILRKGNIVSEKEYVDSLSQVFYNYWKYMEELNKD